MEICPKVIERLGSLGVAAAPDISVNSAIEQAQVLITTNINQTKVPDSLETVFVEMACGLCLKALKATGRLDLESVNFDAPAKTIKEGDVQVTFAAASDGTLTPEARFDALVNSMIHPPSHVFTRFRRLVW